MEKTINDLFGFSDICESETYISGEGTKCTGCVRDGWCIDGAKDTSPTTPCGSEYQKSIPVNSVDGFSSSGSK